MEARRWKQLQKGPTFLDFIKISSFKPHPVTTPSHSCFHLPSSLFHPSLSARAAENPLYFFAQELQVSQVFVPPLGPLVLDKGLATQEVHLLPPKYTRFLRLPDLLVIQAAHTG